MPTAYEDPDFFEGLREAERRYRSTYNYGVAPGTTTLVGGVMWRNDFGAATNNFRGLPFKMHTPLWDPNSTTAPTVTVYSPNSGAANNIYNISTAADVSVSSVDSYLGQNGFSAVFLGASPAAGNLMSAHAVYDLRP